MHIDDLGFESIALSSHECVHALTHSMAHIIDEFRNHLCLPSVFQKLGVTASSADRLAKVKPVLGQYGGTSGSSLKNLEVDFSVTATTRLKKTLVKSRGMQLD